MRSVANFVIQASLVEVDILELSRLPCLGVGVYHTRIGHHRSDDGEGTRPEADSVNG